MPTRLADLDELVLLCRNEGSRELIREAVVCYKAGAFRAAIINAWIATAFDLIEKLRELSLGGDKQAETEVNHFDAIQAGRDLVEALKFERELLTKCRDQFELISPLEFIDLERLSEDRNSCAHPNLIRYSEMYSPNAELVRTHLRCVIEHVLQQPPRVGKAAVEQLFREVQADYFPTDLEEAKRVLNDSPLARAKANVIREFVLGITSRMLKGDLKPAELHKRIAALRACREIHRNYLLELLRSHFPALYQKTGDAGLMPLLVILRHIPEARESVPEGIKARLQRFIEIAPPPDLTIAIRAGLKIEMFREVALKRLAGLDETLLMKVIGGYIANLPEEVVERSLNMYAEATGYDQANSIGAKIIQPILTVLNKAQVLRLFEIGETNGQVGESFGFDSIVKAIKSGTVLTSDEFQHEIKKRGWNQFAEA